MARHGCLTQCSGWKGLVVNWFRSRRDKSQPCQFQPTADTRAAFIKVETTLENLENFLDYVTELCGSLRRDPSSNVRGLLASKWVTYKDMGNSLMNGLPKECEHEVSKISQDLLLPLLKRALEGLGGLHWIFAGLSLIAWSLDIIDTKAQSSQKCLQLLNETAKLLKNKKEIWQAPDEDRVEELQDTVVKTFQCAVICASTVDGCSFVRSLNAETVETLTAKLEKDLDGALEQNTNSAAPGDVGEEYDLTKMPWLVWRALVTEK